MNVFEIVFWVCAALVFYTYIGYLPVLLCLSNLFGRPLPTRTTASAAGQKPDMEEELPSVAVVFSAYNEEKHIKDRIDNLLAQDYPGEKLTLYVGSDGSTDATESILKEYESDPRVKVFAFKQNRGKVSVLNDLVEAVTEPVIVFTDANTEFEPDAIRTLAVHFRDPEVGAVCGELDLYDTGSAENQDSLYWKIERVLKHHESRLGGLLGANGAIYAIRKALYTPLPPDTLVDDFMIVMGVATQGYTVLYDPAAKAREEVAPNLDGEIKRRIRIGTGNYQAFFRLTELFNPKYGWLGFTYISHKVLRWFVPHLMLLAFVSNWFLLESPFYQATLLLQILGYAGLHWVYKQGMASKMPKPIKVLVFLYTMNLAFLMGFKNYLFSEHTGAWGRTER